MDLDWDGLIRVLRAGSRAVLFYPEDNRIPTELAARGFRLMVVHSEREFLDRCRAELRAVGLSSQLMGSSQCPDGELPELVADFYDLFLYCRECALPMDHIAFCLAQDGTLVAPRSQPGWEELEGWTTLERFPAEFVGLRRSNPQGRIAPR